MSTTYKYSKRIANYLYNDMDREEKSQFEKDLLDNEELASEYEFQLSAMKHIKARITLEEMENDPDLEEAERLADEILLEDEPNLEVNGNKTASFPGRKILVRIVAAAAIVLGVVSTTLLITGNSNQALYKSFYKPFEETSLSYRGDNTDVVESIQKGIQLYSSENFLEALEVFRTIQLDNPDNPMINFYIGLSQMGRGEFGQSIELFQHHIETFEIFQPEVKWYLALCYLQTNQIESSSQLFKELSDYPGKYGSDSEKLSRKLERKLDK